MGETWRLGHRPALDGLRGVAVLLVLADHGGFLPEPAGAVGVTVFFTLSGFLITRLIVEARGAGTWSVRVFYANRLARLAPALVLMVFGAGVVAVLRGQSLASLADLAWPALTYTQNFLHGGRAWTMFDHTWSLAVEEQFYLLWPFALPLLLRSSKPLAWLDLLAAGSVLARLTLAPDVGYASLVGNAYAMLIGAGLALAAVRLPRLREPVALVGLAVLVWLAVSTQNVRLNGLVIPVVASVVAGVVVWSAVGGCRVLEVAPLRFAGRISYALYLWHFPLLVMFSVTHAGVAALPVLALTTVLAVVSTLLVEEPVRRAWRRRSLRAPVLEPEPSRVLVG